MRSISEINKPTQSNDVITPIPQFLALIKSLLLSRKYLGSGL
jgi:hypothetical protein